MTTMYQQIPLLFFDEDEEAPQPSRQDAIRAIEWSYSRRESLEQCPLRYYYEYFGANKKKAKGEPDKARLHTLKASSNCYLRTGTILHLIISQFFRNMQAGEPRTHNDAIDWATRLLKKDMDYSRQYPDLPETQGKFPPILLREYIDQPAEADAFYDRVAQRMIEAIRAFFTDVRYEEFRIGGSSAGAVVEYPMHLKTLPCKAAGKIDLAYIANGVVTIVDWKSGGSGGLGEDSLQLAAYGLWAIEHFGCSPEALRVCKVHLGSGEIDFFPINADVLHAARTRIIQDAERMATLDQWARDGVVDVFTPNKKETICRLCAFRGICYA